MPKTRETRSAEKIHRSAIEQIEADLSKKARKIGVKAYHQVLGVNALDRILEEGAILPGAFRLDPQWVEAQCAKGIVRLTRPSPQDDPEAIRAINDQVAYAISELKQFQAERGITGATHPTQLECVDIMFGDAYRVFLSPHEFRFAGPDTGLVYDAYELVERGAVIRGLDFIRRYKEILDEVIRGGGEYGWITHPGERMETMVEDLHARELSDLGELDRFALNRDAASQAEVVWEGPLPVAWAIEVIRDGRVERLRSPKD